jgi:hypothetical protein
VHTFISTVAMEDSAPLPTFKEALTDFFGRIKTIGNEGKLSYQLLETACWVQLQVGEKKSAPLDFYATREFAHDIGMTDDEGNIIEAPEPSLQVLRRPFIIQL